MQDSENYNEIEKFVFVVTYGRAGSTLVQNLLNSIDGYCIRGENNNALAPLALAWDTIHKSKNIQNHLKKNKTSTPDRPWYGAELINGPQLGKELAEVFVRQVLAPPKGTRVAGFKEIRWGGNIPFLPTLLNYAHEMFPNAHFIFNTRDHDEIARSGWWANMEPERVKAKIAKIDVAFARYLETYPGRGIHIHYNDYAKNPKALEPLFKYLGEGFDLDHVSAVLEHRLTHLQVDKA